MQRALRSATRTFSTSVATRPLAARHYVDAFYRDTQNPVWLLLDNLKSPAGRLHLEAALIESRVDPNEFATWRPVIVHHDIQQAVADVRRSSTTIPAWVVLYLVLYKVRTADHAAKPLLDLVHLYLPTAPPETHGPLLVLAAHHLARHNLLVPLQALVGTFLTTPLPLAAQEATFNLFLEALANTPLRSAAAANEVVRVLAAMDARQLVLRSGTYRALLADRFVTLQLTKHLLARMGREHVAPTAAHLEGFLRVFARNGAIHEARKYFTAIHAVTTGPPMEGYDPRYAANTLMLAAHEDKASAFTFLRRLAQLSEEAEAASPAPPATVPQKIRFISRPGDNIYDQTAALHVAARDLRSSSHRLIRSFLRMSARPTVATHTVLIRGLLFRKAYTKAALFWLRLERECLGLTNGGGGWGVDASELEDEAEYEAPAWARTRERRMVMDNAALTAGLQALIRSERSAKALEILERWAWRPALNSIDDSIKRGPPRVRLTTISANELLVSLKRAGRPDAVFALWDALPRYGVLPDAVSLSVLLQAARLACTLDDSVGGALARAKARVRGVLSPPEPHAGVGFDGVDDDADSDIAFARLAALLGTPAQPRGYVAGTWRGRPPLDAARGVFLQVLFGMDAAHTLDATLAPAAAVRTSHDGAPSARTLLRAPAPYVFAPPAGVALHRPGGGSWYPSVVASNACVFNYVALLGTGGRAGELALVLAWMRALGLQPSEATLALALVFWGEVGVQAPLVEMWGGTGAGDDGPGEYGRLVRWIREWVGEKRVPGPRAMEKWRGVVRGMRATGSNG
ncbi:hypothetical protein HYPSUDRAFT_213818 [Hypholoma sublateritium FD-334 SS-4]|uniref:Pentacotripeptide-repeat region of PRORP domain-containing protein n=1 Tax=Hypholoma sublateritium (strain FD-334 SS-4) TaxID=945553 RepID=A0A0D2P9X7_HYPSF|nr:hypothetical protein HYPSUDRAFT_213818 [Hypholoma sublateritium FD-334 SS-4]